MYQLNSNGKFIRIFLLCLTLLTLLTVSAYAHPGRLDSNGGHHDRSDGSYHYHDGNSSGRKSSSSKTTTKNYNYNYNSSQKKSTNKKKNIVQEEIFSSKYLPVILIVAYVALIVFGGMFSKRR